jgi:glucosamine-6-phosphate deaminase
MSAFSFRPSKWVPFADEAVIARCRAIRREQIDKHPNPNFRIRVVNDADVEFIWVTDMVRRLKQAADQRAPLVMILPNPCPTYRHVARLVNALKIDCSRLHAFAMDEYADQDGHIAPEMWDKGFTYAMKHDFFNQIDPELRPPDRQVVGFTDRNIGSYSKMIADLGGADICYSGPGWTGHLAFIEPDAPELDAPLARWRTFGARVVTLSPFTLAQNSLHGSFGMSGDLAAVPPKAATIGPADVIAAKHRVDVSALTIHGTQTTWQRLIARLVYHGPVTPRLPTSILQELSTDVYISESIARNIEPDFSKGY